jgi:hypothetical protein
MSQPGGDGGGGGALVRRRILAHQSNDLLVRLHDARRSLFRQAPTMSLPAYRHQKARLDRAIPRAFARLVRRLEQA